MYRNVSNQKKKIQKKISELKGKSKMAEKLRNSQKKRRHCDCMCDYTADGVVYNQQAQHKSVG